MVLGRAGLHGDLGDALAAELGLADRATPGETTVCRLVKADTGDAARCTSVGLTGADIDRQAQRVVGVDAHLARGVDAKRATEVAPLRSRARMFQVRHTPPPAGVIQAGHRIAMQNLLIAIEVVRPPATYSLGT